MPRALRLRPTRLALSILLGSLTTIAITVVGLRPDAISPGPKVSAVVIDTDRFWQVFHDRSFARVFTTMNIQNGKLVPWGRRGYVAELPGGITAPQMYSTILNRPPAQPPDGASDFMRIDAGWPFATLRGESVCMPNSEPVTHGVTVTTSTSFLGIPLPRGRTATPGMGRNDFDANLPSDPYWPGLIANLAIWTAPWFLGLVLWSSLVARSRRRRGCCGVCGYSLKGQTQPGCPECGTGREVGSAGGHSAGRDGAALGPAAAGIAPAAEIPSAGPA